MIQPRSIVTVYSFFRVCKIDAVNSLPLVPCGVLIALHPQVTQPNAQ